MNKLLEFAIQFPLPIAIILVTLPIVLLGIDTYYLIQLMGHIGGDLGAGITGGILIALYVFTIRKE